MAVLALKQELALFISQMYNEGVLDRQFEDLRGLQEVGNPCFVAEVLSLFCEDNERIIREMDKLVKPVLNLPMVEDYVHQLKGSSVSVGAKQIKLACNEFRHASERNDEPGCVRAVFMIKREFYRVKSTFTRVIELERQINGLKTQQRA